MNYVIVYWSRYGHNRRLADRLADRLRERGGEVQVFKTDEVDAAALPDADVYVFSGPTEAFRVQRDMRGFMKKLGGMDGKKYGIINTHGMKRNWLPSMEKILSKRKNMEQVAAADFRVGKDDDGELDFLEDWQAKLDAFADRL